MKQCSIRLSILFIICFCYFYFVGGIETGNAICKNDCLRYTPSKAYASAFGGSFAGLLLGGATGYGVAYLSGASSSETDINGISIAISMLLGASIGVSVGAATKIYYDSNQSCPFWRLFAIATLPEMTILLIGVISGHILYSPILVIVGWILAPISAAAYYNSYQKHQSEKGLLNISNNQLKFEFPKLNMKFVTKPGNLYINVPRSTAILEYKINLLTIEF